MPMTHPINFHYHYGQEAEQYTFFRIPKALITDSYFQSLSTDAKLLYGLMLDRMSLSLKNRWIDKEKRVYIYFSVKDICEQLGCGRDKAMKLLAELDSHNGIGLIERVRQGQGKPSRIYIKRFMPEEKHQQPENPNLKEQANQNPEVAKPDFQRSEKTTFRSRKKQRKEVESSDPNNTKKNKNEISQIHPSVFQKEQPELLERIEQYRNQIRKNIEYEILIEQHPREDIDELVEIMLEVFCTQDDFVKIGKKQIYTELVKERFQKITLRHIEYLLNRMKETPSDIHNIKAYLLESLFNAPATIGSYFKARVNYDFYGNYQS